MQGPSEKRLGDDADEEAERDEEPGEAEGTGGLGKIPDERGESVVDFHAPESARDA